MDQSGKGASSHQDLVDLAAKVEAVRKRTTLSDELQDLLDKVSFQFNSLLQKNEDRVDWHETLEEIHYRELVENANILILRMDAKGTIQFLNPFAQDFFGYTQAEIQGRNGVGTILPETKSPRQDLATIIDDSYHQPEQYPIYENEHLLRNGERAWIVWRNKPLLDEAGQIIGWLCIGNDITARKQAEEALATSEEKFRCLAQQSLEGIVLVDEQGLIREWNQAQEQITGLKQIDVMGRFLWDVQFQLATDEQKTPVLHKTIVENFQALFDKRDPPWLRQLQEHELQRPDGSRCFVQTLTFPIVTSNGLMVGSIVRDITERKLMQRTLHLSNERYHRAMNVSRAGVWEWDIATNHLYIDPHLKAQLGYADDELENSLDAWAQVVHAADSNIAMQAMQAHFDGLKPTYQVEYRVAHKDGSLRWLLARGVALRNAEGTPYQVVGTSIDITDLKETRIALEESEKRHQIIRNAIPDSVYLINQDGIILDTNHKHGLIPNRSHSEIVGMPIHELLPAKTVEKMRHHIEQALQTSTIQIWESAIPTEHLLTTYEIRMVAINETEVLIIGRDITEQKRVTENQLERERIRLLRQFMDDTSHDLKTPITTLMTSTYLLNRLTAILHHDQERLAALVGDIIEADKLLENLTQTTTKIHERASTLEQSALRLRRLVESMADMVRLDSDIQYTMRLEDLNILTHIVVEDLLSQAKSCQITLNDEIDNKPLLVFVDEMEFSRAIKHLIENALEYTPAGGTVTVRVYKKEPRAILEVHDTGIGIEYNHLHHIFERFYRVDKTRSADTGGVGLGLTIVKRVVEAHNGQIEVQSSPGTGSLFRVGIPLYTKPTSK